MPAATCTNCGADLVRTYCAVCGQRQPAALDRSFRGLVAVAVEELFSVDSKLWLTFKTLLTLPGQLSVDYLGGRSGRYLPPLRLFIVLAAVFVFVGFSVALNLEAMVRSAERFNPDSAARFLALLDARAADQGISREALIGQVDGQLEIMLNWLFPLTVLPFAGVVHLLFLGAGRYFAEHFIFAMHFYCLAFILSTISQLVIALLPTALTVLPLLSLVVGSTYFYLAARRFYGRAGRGLVVRSVAAWVLKLGIKVVAGVLIIGGVLLFGSMGGS